VLHHHDGVGVHRTALAKRQVVIWSADGALTTHERLLKDRVAHLRLHVLDLLGEVHQVVGVLFGLRRLLSFGFDELGLELVELRLLLVDSRQVVFDLLIELVPLHAVYLFLLIDLLLKFFDPRV